MQLDVNLRYALIRMANTGLYIFCKSRFDTLGMNPDENGGMPVTPYRRTMDRALLAKFTYLFDF